MNDQDIVTEPGLGILFRAYPDHDTKYTKVPWDHRDAFP